MKPPKLNSEAVLREARSWLGTPYRHMAREKGAAVDCVQFVLAVGEAVGASGRIDPGPYRMINHPTKTRQLAERFGIEIPEPALGSIVFWGRKQNFPTHFGFLTDLYGARSVIHCDPGYGKVVEHTIPPEQLVLINSYWWFK